MFSGLEEEGVAVPVCELPRDMGVEFWLLALEVVERSWAGSPKGC